MPRRSRVIVPGMPHHVVQRGHNRSVAFVDPVESGRVEVGIQPCRAHARARLYRLPPSVGRVACGLAGGENGAVYRETVCE